MTGGINIIFLVEPFSAELVMISLLGEEMQTLIDGRQTALCLTLNKNHICIELHRGKCISGQIQGTINHIL